MPIKVRVGQSDAIKILSSAGGGSVKAQTSTNVIGGIASVSQLSVTGITTLSNVVAGVITATSFVGPLTGDVTGIIQTAAQPNITSVGTLSSLNVTGLSTFVGIVTTSNDLFVGGDLFIKDDIVLDNVTGNSLNILGISTVNSLKVVNDAVIEGNLSVGGTITYDDVTNVDSVGIVTAGKGLRATTGGLVVTAGVSTFNDDVVFQGAAPSQNITFDHSENDLEFSDLARAKFGDNDNLEIWHGTGNDSHIKSKTNDLKIRSDSLILKREDDSEPYLKATVNSDVKIYYNGNEKFATTNTGVNITGTLTAELIDGGSF